MPLVGGKLGVIVSLTNLVDGSTLLGTKVVVALTTDPRRGVEFFVGAAFEIAGTLVNPLEISVDLGISIVAEILAFVPITPVVPE